MFIYIITNIVNGKVYIGQTIKPINDRFYQHICSSNIGSDLFIHRSIRKYGANNFSIRKLCRCDNKIQLNSLEIFYIKRFKSNNSKFGYNMTAGGDGGILSDEAKEKFLSTCQSKEYLEKQQKPGKRGLNFKGRKHKESTKSIMSDLRKDATPPNLGRELNDKWKFNLGNYGREKKISSKTNELLLYLAKP